MMAESKAATAALRSLAATGELAAPTAGPPPPALVEAARVQGLCGLLLQTIERDSTGWAEEDVSALKRERRAALVRTIGQIDLARRVIELLDSRGIRSLPLKGAALAGTVYDVESDRPMSDVDVLALERWKSGVELLRAEGFVEIARGDHAWALRDPASGEIVELHRSVTSCPGLFPLPIESLWERSRAGRGQLSRLPSPEDLLLQLALHASFQHGLVLPLFQWLDFRRVLERESIDTPRLLSVAAESRAEVPLVASLLVAEAVVGAQVPPALRSATEAHATPSLRRWLGRRTGSPLAFVASVGSPDYARVRWMLVPQPSRRVQLVWRTLVVPEGPEEASRWGRLAEATARAWRFAGLVGKKRAEPGEAAPDDARTGEDAPPGHDAAAGPTGGGDSPDPGGSAGARVLGPRDRDRVLRECLASFPWVRLTVTGRCMQPALEHGEKVHLVSAARRPPRMGDVVLACGAQGLVLHRLVWGPPFALPGTRWRIKADRGLLFDPPLVPADVLATVVAIERRLAARPGRPALALLSLWRGVVARVRLGQKAEDAESAA